ncbi:hypothetical protein HD806DRAFT_207895 [Xylariaceae sp. AK1471]|nr:hypothetical protein HD806DRAFT_207895 [Xylariaceae sp. AK1471]
MATTAPADTTSAEYICWDKKRALAFHLLRFSVSNNLQHVNQGSTTDDPYQYLKQIQAAMHYDAAAEIPAKMTELVNLPGTFEWLGCDTFIREFIKLRAELEDMGCVIDGLAALGMVINAVEETRPTYARMLRDKYLLEGKVNWDLFETDAIMGFQLNDVASWPSQTAEPSNYGSAPTDNFEEVSNGPTVGAWPRGSSEKEGTPTEVPQSPSHEDPHISSSPPPPANTWFTASSAVTPVPRREKARDRWSLPSSSTPPQSQNNSWFAKTPVPRRETDRNGWHLPSAPPPPPRNNDRGDASPVPRDEAARDEWGSPLTAPPLSPQLQNNSSFTASPAASPAPRRRVTCYWDSHSPSQQTPGYENSRKSTSTADYDDPFVLTPTHSSKKSDSAWW